MSISALSQISHQKRLYSYLHKKGLNVTSEPSTFVTENPFTNSELRQYFLRELIRFTPSFPINCAIFAGLVTTALYLARYKFPWRRAIVLGLRQNLGRAIENIIIRARAIPIDQPHHALLSRLMMAALDSAK